jgi:hypothetical protein
VAAGDALGVEGVKVGRGGDTATDRLGSFNDVMNPRKTATPIKRATRPIVRNMACGAGPVDSEDPKAGSSLSAACLAELIRNLVEQ